MIDVAGELSVQSWCFRHFTEHEQAIERIKACGLSQVELSGAHIDFSDEASFDEAIAAYRDGGMPIPSIGVVKITPDESEARKPFEFARKAGASVLSVDFPVGGAAEAYRVAERLAEAYDVRLGIHNHGGRHWLGNAQTLEQVFAETGERIGLCLDTAWALDAGEDPVAMAERFGDRLFGLHLKDFVFDRARRPEDVVVGTGNLDLPALYGVLKGLDFGGVCVLEYEGDVEDPVPAVSECVQAVRRVMTG